MRRIQAETPAASEHVEDLQLVRDVLAGSISAWHRFVESYSNLILTMVRRVLRGDEDEVRAVFVEVLERLYRGRLARYEGRARLSTWLVLVTRNLALDTLRKRIGRRELPAALAHFSSVEQKIFRWYHWDGDSIATIRDRLAIDGSPPSMDDVLDTLTRIEAQLSDRTLRRLAYELHAASVGAASGRLLEFLDDYREKAARAYEDQTPAAELVAREAGERLERVRLLVEKLPDEERRALNLRFHARRSAREISAVMGLGGQRKAYTLVERALRRLRRWLQVAPDA